jgi:hypothetical protein
VVLLLAGPTRGTWAPFFFMESFERDNDFADYNLSELGYWEIFLTSLMRSLFPLGNEYFFVGI